ncbi:TRAP transporter large permease [Thermatribacter velox]|uniref:TRAP transporter large permease n=1 Tax=Thermatribacter velox TaxID=3039681 RepID=A0ABZ2YDJ1_9BACT
MIVYLLIGTFAVLFLLGVPVILSITLPSVIYFLLKHVPIDIVAQRFHYALNSFPLVAVPVFILAGNLMNSTRHTERIFKFADSLVGHLPGGLAQVNIFASLIFSGMSGAALADVGGLGQIEIKAMEERGFKKEFAAAVTMASATVGPIFPPSIPLVIYGAVTGTSVIKLLMGGIMPAILAVVVMMIITAIIALFRNLPRAESRAEFAVIWANFKEALPSLLAPVMLVFGMLSGYFTPTEAASITVAYLLLISIFVYRDFNFKALLRATYETIRSTSAIMIIVASASLFSWILAVENFPAVVHSFIGQFCENRLLLLLFVNVLMFIIGMFLDSTTATILVVPIIVPPILASGIDPVHLGIIIIFNLMLGLMTPPMGLSLFLISDIAKVPMGKVLRNVAPYFIALVASLLIITFVPWFSTYIPGVLMGK